MSISDLTIEEKSSLLSGNGRWRTKGIPRLGIKAVKLSDDPNGIRGEAIHAPSKATCFPCLSCVGARFNTTLSSQIGECLAIEARLKNSGVVLGPTMNIQRHPFGGRGFESYSEDAVLTGELAAAYVNGIQSKGIGACPKHLVCNECELFRTESDSIVDDVTLREMYLLPFQICLKKAKPWTIMAAYNKLNGESCTENSWLLTQLLRKEWGFEGLTMSDWDAVYSQIEPVKAGCNLEMPGPSIHRGAKLVDSVKSGAISMEEVDMNVKRILELSAKAGMDDETAPEKVIVHLAIAKIAHQAAEEGIVLLKNKDNVLPIPKDTNLKIAVFGAPAKTPIIHGGGSSSLSLTSSHLSKPYKRPTKTSSTATAYPYS